MTRSRGHIGLAAEYDTAFRYNACLGEIESVKLTVSWSVPGPVEDRNERHERYPDDGDRGYPHHGPEQISVGSWVDVDADDVGVLRHGQFRQLFVCGWCVSLRLGYRTSLRSLLAFKNSH